MFRDKYKQMCNQVQPSQELLINVFKSTKTCKNKKSTITLFLRKPIIAFVLICVCISLTLPSLTSAAEPVYQLIYTVSPSMAQFFMPVQKSDEDNGIKMEIVSAYIHDNVAEIYITMQDLIGDRIDGTTDLYDSYSINRPFDSAATCQQVGYDEKTKTVTFLISITEWGNQKIVGDKITFSVKEFLSHKKDYHNIEIPLSLSSALAAKDTQKVSTLGGGGEDYGKYMDNDEAIVLTPSQGIDKFPVEGFQLSAIGYADDMLHVQMTIFDRLKSGNYGFFYLKDSNGSNVNCNYNSYFTNDQKSSRTDYCEYVFNIPKDQIADYSLYGDFFVFGKRTEGNWRVTFPLKQENNK